MFRIKLSLALVFLIFVSCQNHEKKHLKTKKLLQGVIKNNENEKIKKLPDGAIKITYHNHIYFPLDFDTIRGNFAFDTGANRLYFDSIFYYSNNYKNKNIVKGRIPGVGLKTETIKVIVDSIHFKLKENKFSTRITPILKLKPIIGDFADGIFGNELLKESILEVSYDKEYIKIHSSIDSIDVSFYKKIKLFKVKNRLYLFLKIKINNSLSVKGKFILDLGSGSSISFTNHTSKQYNFKNKIVDKNFYYSKYAGIGGESSSFEFKADSLWIGGFKLSKLFLEYSLDTSGALSKRKYLGILGNKILEKFDIIIDNINNNLYLKPNSLNKKTFALKNGFSFVDRSKTKGAWVVSSLCKGCNAEKAGLKIDDKIIMVNDISIKSIEVKQKETVFKKENFIKLVIKKNDGTTKKIKFELETKIKNH